MDITEPPPPAARLQLFVGNLPYRVRWQDLKDLFRKAGTPVRADVALGVDNRSRGYGTVLMSSDAETTLAIRLFHNLSWQGRTLEVRIDRAADVVNLSQVDLGGLAAGMPYFPPPQVGDEALTLPVVLPMGVVHLSPESGNRQRLQMHVQGVVRPNGAQQSLQQRQNQQHTNQHQFHPQQQHHQQQQHYQQQNHQQHHNHHNHPPPHPAAHFGPMVRNIIISNLPPDYPRTDLLSLLRPAGSILHLDLAPDFGLAPGVANVFLGSAAEAVQAVKIADGLELNGRVVRAQFDRQSLDSSNPESFGAGIAQNGHVTAPRQINSQFQQNYRNQPNHSQNQNLMQHPNQQPSYHQNGHVNGAQYSRIDQRASSFPPAESSSSFSSQNSARHTPLNSAAYPYIPPEFIPRSHVTAQQKSSSESLDSQSSTAASPFVNNPSSFSWGTKSANMSFENLHLSTSVSENADKRSQSAGSNRHESAGVSKEASSHGQNVPQDSQAMQKHKPSPLYYTGPSSNSHLNRNKDPAPGRLSMTFTNTNNNMQFDPFSPLPSIPSEPNATGDHMITPSMPGFVFNPYPATPPPLLPQFLSPGLGPFSPPANGPRYWGPQVPYNPAPGAPVWKKFNDANTSTISSGSAKDGDEPGYPFPAVESAGLGLAAPSDDKNQSSKSSVGNVVNLLQHLELNIRPPRSASSLSNRSDRTATEGNYMQNTKSEFSDEPSKESRPGLSRRRSSHSGGSVVATSNDTDEPTSSLNVSGTERNDVRRASFNEPLVRRDIWNA